MKTKETWIDETLDALEGIRRAQAGPGLVEKVMDLPLHPEAVKTWRGRVYYWPVAAGIAILITLNVLAILYSQSLHALSQAAPAAMAIDYLSYLGPLNL
jgi:hypothetical protein